MASDEPERTGGRAPQSQRRGGGSPPGDVAGSDDRDRGPLDPEQGAPPVRMWQGAVAVRESCAFSETRETPEGTARLVRMPIGVVGTIIPWNAPVPSASMKLPAALAAGCTVVLKPAPEGPVSTMMLAEAFEAAELPEGVISVIPAGREVGESLVRHPGVDKIAFTGSTAAGR